MNLLANAAEYLRPKPQAFTTSGFNAATSGRRMVNVGNTSRGISGLALSDGQMLRERARKLVMDNPRATIGVAAFVSEIIGTGIRPHSKHPDPVKARFIEKKFFNWTKQSSAARRVGLDGKPDSMLGFFYQQQLVCRNVVVPGEAFARLRSRYQSDLSPTGLEVPLQIELIEPEQLSFWRTSGDGMLDGNIIRGGIELNPQHERVAYYFYREHPGDAAIWPNSYEIVRVPSGSVLHMMEFQSENQLRGITSLAPIIVALNDIDEYDDAERMRQKLGAFMFAWKKTAQPDTPNMEINSMAGNDLADPGTSYVEAQPGQFNILDTQIGEDFGFYAHPGVEKGYVDFMRIQDRQLATAMRITYDMLTGDMTDVNYSSARVRLIAIRRQWQQFQRSVIEHQFCRPVFKAWLDAAALQGVINASDYRKNAEDYLAVEWMTQPWEWIDPKTDIDGIRMEMESCLIDRGSVVASRGRDVGEVDAAIQQDHIREAKLGVVPVYGSVRVTETLAETGSTDLSGSGSSAPKPAAPAKSAPKPAGGK